MTTPPRLGHVALAARDPYRLGAFYAAVLGLRVVRRVDHPLAGHELQLGGNRVCQHQVVFSTNPEAGHVGFEVDTRAGLARSYARASDLGLEIPYAHATGRAVSFFVRDPEGSLVEVYWATGLARRESPPLSDRRAIHGLITGG